MEITRGDGEIRAVDEAANAVRLGLSGFDPGGDPPSVTAALSRVDTGPATPAATVSGTVERITMRPMFVAVTDLDTGERHLFGNGCESSSLPAGAYLARIDGSVRAFVRFSGPAELGRVGPDRVALSFPSPAAVSIGFESRVALPEETVTVEPTPAGAAAAVTACNATTTNTSPDRTWPTQRTHPPNVELGDETRVPAAVRDGRPDTGVRLTVPPEMGAVFTTAPLAQYLGAEVRTAADADPHLSLDGRRVPLGERPAARANELLQRVFYLDCVVRGAGPHGGNLAVDDVLDELGLDAASLYPASMADRVASYLSVPFDRVRDRFPDWHLAMYVEPSTDHVPVLPYLLDDLPIVRLPRSEPLDKKEWLRLTVNDGFETPGDRLVSDGATRVRREISNVDLVEPELTRAQSHGWMAQKVPIDVFKTFPAAYENRLGYLDDDNPLQVTAVVNDREAPLLLTDEDDSAMRTEHEAAVSHYEARADQLPIDITVRENVTTAELARIFESRNDLVHYIGHRDDRGLECVNGYFSTDTLRESNTQTFFLNACGSYPDGETLIRKGSVAGGITYEHVSDEDAATVGVTFARLLMLGFCIERATRIASQQVLTPKDYAVVGDGTHVLTQSDSIIPPNVWLFDAPDGYEIVLQQTCPSQTGGQVQWEFEETNHLWRSRCRYELSDEELREYLDVLDSPIVYDDRLFWPEDLRTEL